VPCWPWVSTIHSSCSMTIAPSSRRSWIF